MKQATLDFMVWRAGQSVGWDCTAADIAAEIGISEARIYESLSRRGWRKRMPGRAVNKGSPDRLPVDSLMRSQYLQVRGFQ